MPRARPYVFTVRLNAEELEVLKWLCRNVAGIPGAHLEWKGYKSQAFRRFLHEMAAFVRKEDEALDRRRRLSGFLEKWPDFAPPKATKGPSEVEVSGPEEIESYEEMENY